MEMRTGSAVAGDSRVGFRRGLVLLIAALAMAVSVVAISGATAQADEPGIQELEFVPSSTQAGGHPDVFFRFAWNTSSGSEGACLEDPPCLNARTIGVHWPTGFIGNPHVAPKCTLAEFSMSSCPVDSQIGVFEVNLGFFLFFPVYNMETGPDQAGLLGLTTPLVVAQVFLDLRGRTDSDYGLDAISSPQLRGLDFGHIQGHLWGVPADPIHNPERFITPLSSTGACYREYFETEGCPPGYSFVSPTFAQSTIPEAPFLQNPTTCGETLTAHGDIEYYGGFKTETASASYPTTTGCNQIGFNPSISVKPTTGRADTASGLDTVLRVPQPQSATTPSSSEIRTAKVTLPEGFTINPNAADGKVACPDDETSIGTLFAAHCPEFSKIGTAMIDVAALPAPIPGAIYLGEPRPGEPYRVILTGDGFATHVKLVGNVSPDPQTGRVTISFVDLPQTPLQEFNLHVFGSERGLFATPKRCGTNTVGSEFVPWNSVLTTRTALSFMTTDSGVNGQGCPSSGPLPFNPHMVAGTSNTTAGAHSSFSLTLNRDDGDQNMTAISVSTPRGFAATLKGVPYCPQSAIDQLAAAGYPGRAEQATPSCPSSTQIGTATAGAGAGTHPLYVPGRVYLAGPYKGSPLSLEVVIPAVSGPYDLGVIAVRTAIDVNPSTARVSAVSDPLPQIFEGIPLRTRFIQVDLDRPDFALNATNCDPSDVSAVLSGDEAGMATPTNNYQVANCTSLPYSPKLGLKLSGGVKRRGHPAIRAVFTAKPGEANSREVSVALPAGELLDNAHIGTICTRVQFAADSCPAASAIGTAEATTPLLDAPLSGTVYLRSSSHELPDLVVDLEGQFDFELVGRIDTAKGGALRTTFESVPDVPVSQFVVNLAGGAKGLLQNSESLCATAKKATVKMTGQNGSVVKTKAKLQTSCGSKKARHKRHKRHSDARKAG
jgi:hypothetical protein